MIRLISIFSFVALGSPAQRREIGVKFFGESLLILAFFVGSWSRRRQSKGESIGNCIFDDRFSVFVTRNPSPRLVAYLLQ